MMDAYFNELSVPPLGDMEQLDRLIEKYARVIKDAKLQGFNTIRYEKGVEAIMLTENYSLSQYLYKHQTSLAVNVLLTTQAKPYIPEGDSTEDTYILNDYAVRVNDKQVKSEGFTAAAIAGSITIGFESPEWSEDSYIVTETNESGSRRFNVLYASDTTFFLSNAFQSWADSSLPPTIVPSELLPFEKEIHLSQHHGYDELMRFAKRLRNEIYVNKIVNSIDRDSNVKQFARCKFGTKIIEITLIKNGCYGLAVSTTARNDRELRYIAKQITEKYS